MKSKGIATIVLASAAFLVSCQKDDLNISPQPFPSRIEKISMDNDLMTLNYDAGGRVSTVSCPTRYKEARHLLNSRSVMTRPAGSRN